MAPAPSPSSLAPDLDRSWEWGAKREMGVRGRASGNREGGGVFEGSNRETAREKKKTG